MLLRTRVTLIVSITYSLLVIGLAFAGLKSEELANERYAQATLNGQALFWRKLVENTVQRLEGLAPMLTGRAELVQAAARNNPAATLEAIAAVAEPLRARGAGRLELVGRDGDLLYSSRGSLLEPPLVDAGTVRLIVDTGMWQRGMVQDADRQFTATVALPLVSADGAVAGVATLAADLKPPLDEFKASTNSDVFLVDRVGHMSLGTDEQLWNVLDGKISVRKSGLISLRDGDRFYSVVVFPLEGADHRVIGALVSARDFTETQARQDLIRKVSFAAVITFLVLVLFVFYVYLRRSFNPLEQAITVLNALSRGDTSVTLDVRNSNDEIGRIASTVGVFRENAIQLEMLQERRERQRRRQELFIRLQMLKLSEMLEQEAQAAILADLKQIEEMASRKSEDGRGEGDKAELDVLAVAFQTMSSRIRAQHESLESLIAERTRDVEILREALRTRDQLAALRQELDFARELQLSSLPQVFPPFPDRDEFQIHAAMVPAKEVGGDFYDFFLIDRHHLGFVIGDASGKGVPAAMFIAITRSLIKAVAPLSGTPGECLAFVNTMLSRDNPQTLFATCFYAVLDVRSGEVAFCNAGHPPPLIQRADGSVDAIRDVSGVALGVMEDLDYDTGSFALTPGETVLLYTDGVTEAQDAREALYEEPRLMGQLGQSVKLEPEGLIAAVQGAVEAFVGDAPQFDDITMLALRFDRASAEHGGGEEPQRRLMLTGFKPTAAEPAPPPPPPPAPVARPVAVTGQIPRPTAAQPAPGKLTVRIGKPVPASQVASQGVAAVAEVLRPQPSKAEPMPPPASAHRRLEVTISNDLGELERLAALVDDFVQKNALPDKIAFNLNVCLDELITNIVSYGYDDDRHHDIKVMFTLDGETLVTEIIDDAKEYNPFVEAPEPDLDAGVDDRPIGGLGVFLVKEFMTRTDYRHEDGRNTTTLWKSVKEQEN
jgi:sigma-B regulation protein RsbU (phosphoserine phosphatase)